jgi:hypothetical protein
MPRSERERREDLEPTTGRVAPSPEVVAPVPAAVLRMQESAGNRATADLLARVPARGSGKPEPVPDNIPAGTLDVDGFGVYQASSWAARGKANELTVWIPDSGDSARLFVASHRGEHIKRIWLYSGSRRITLTDVLIVTARAADGLMELEFNAGKIDW